jgi:hypothetical protein
MKKIAKGKPKASKLKPKRVAPSLKGSDRPKVSLFLNRVDRDAAKRAAVKAGVTLTEWLEQAALTRLKKKVA